MRNHILEVRMTSQAASVFQPTHNWAGMDPSLITPSYSARSALPVLEALLCISTESSSYLPLLCAQLRCYLPEI